MNDPDAIFAYVSITEATSDAGLSIVLLTLDTESVVLNRSQIIGLHSWTGEWLARHSAEHAR